MAVNAKNIILGSGHLYYAPATTALPTPTPAGAGVAGQTMREALDAAAAWTYAGATTDGVEISYDPEYTDIEVDQVKAPVMMFNTGLTVSVGTNLAEATLSNLLVAWGQPGSPDGAATGSLSVLGTSGQSLKIADLPDVPVERVIAIVGNGPRGVLEDSGAPAGARIERIYYGTRAVSVEGSSHSLQKADATVFPVTFRLLPDVTPGAEYGVITDRIAQPATA